MEKVEREFKEKGTVSKRITMPLLFWEEWELDCKENFNDTYHLKMQFDHQFRKDFSAMCNMLAEDIIMLRDEVAILKTQLEQIQSQPVIEKRKTFGDKNGKN
jgi:hypothetical protein